jgi:methyl-accepting chemotaxis protein
VNELVGEITAASLEQAQGLEQINRAMSHVDAVTQKNAAGAEENASAATNMKVESAHLQKIVEALDELVKGGGKGSAKEEVYTTPTTSYHSQRSAGGRAHVSGGSSRSKQIFNQSSNSFKMDSTASRQDPSKILPLDENDFEDF